MCQISKTLFNLAKRTDSHDVLNNPQDFLGLNTDQLLDFWSTLDTLTEDQKGIIEGRYRSFYVYKSREWDKAAGAAYRAYNETISYKIAFTVLKAVEDVYGYGCDAAWYATQEIIGGVQDKVFLKMFDNL